MSQSNGKKRQRRQFTPEVKATILRRHLADKVPVSDLCDEYQIQPTLFYLWQRQALEHLSVALSEGRTAGIRPPRCRPSGPGSSPWKRAWRRRIRSSPRSRKSISR